MGLKTRNKRTKTNPPPPHTILYSDRVPVVAPEGLPSLNFSGPLCCAQSKPGPSNYHGLVSVSSLWDSEKPPLSAWGPETLPPRLDACSEQMSVSISTLGPSFRAASTVCCSISTADTFWDLLLYLVSNLLHSFYVYSMIWGCI